MILLVALSFPVVISVFAHILFSKKITLKELGLQLGIIFIVIGAMYPIMLCRNTSDTEFLNGAIAEKHEYRQSCCHSYPCNCTTTCDSKNNCTTSCQTCYEHSHDIGWSASSTTGAVVYDNDCNSPHSDVPARYNLIYLGEPTSEEHSYTNYIQANPQSILRRSAVDAHLLAQVPEYPQVYDYYHSWRVLDLGVQGVDVRALNHELDFINSQLGAKKQVNIILIISKESDPTFGEAIRQKWLGGKKNDVVVVIGTPHFPEIAWVDTVSWTQSETMKINIRDNILAMKTFDGRNVLGIIAYEINTGFARRHMRDFKYLMAGIEPSRGQTTFLFIFAILLSIGLSIYNYEADPFSEDPSNNNRYYSRRYY